VDFILFNTVRNEVVSDFDVLSALATQGNPIVCKEDGALIVLK
jgi:hypothetical protein